MKPGKIVAAVVAVIVALISVGMIVGGFAITWALTTQRDADGFITSPDYGLASAGFAVTSADVDLASRPGDWFPSDIADVRLAATGADPVFIGIGPSADVEGYLGTVARDEVTELGIEASDTSLRFREGGAPDGLPADQGFWVVSSEGTGSQSVTWAVEQGSWSVAVMNADASAGVAVEFTAGVKMPVLIAIAVGLFVFGLLFGIAAALLLVWATRADRDAPAAIAGSPAAVAGAYPARLDGTLAPELSRWKWLVKWFLAIPHLIALAFLFVAFVLLTIVAFFAILFTGRYPKGIFDFNVGVLRWEWRVAYYAFSALGTDVYPPFTLEATDYPADFQVEYPERLSRGLVLVKWWLLAIPHYIIAGVFTSGLVWWTTDLDGDAVLQAGGGLIGLLVIVAAIILAFTGRYPQGLFDLIMGLNRWVFRVVAYAGLMRDEYPPFRLDLGGADPGTAGDPGDDTAIQTG